MAFVSHLPLTPGSLAGVVYVKYAVGVITGEDGGDKEHLGFYERPVLLPDEGPDFPEPRESDFSELLSGMENIVFEYLKTRPEEEESPWQEAWDPVVEKGAPRAVRITLRANDEKAPVYMIAAAGS